MTALDLWQAFVFVGLFVCPLLLIIGLFPQCLWASLSMRYSHPMHTVDGAFPVEG